MLSSEALGFTAFALVALSAGQDFFTQQNGRTRILGSSFGILGINATFDYVVCRSYLAVALRIDANLDYWRRHGRPHSRTTLGHKPSTLDRGSGRRQLLRDRQWELLTDTCIRCRILISRPCINSTVGGLGHRNCPAGRMSPDGFPRRLLDSTIVLIPNSIWTIAEFIIPRASA